MITRVWDIRCAYCGTEQTVGEKYWPATRWEPADGELERDECEKCGEPLQEGEWTPAEPPDPEPPDPY